MAKCTNCKTCYQQVSEVFEKTRIVVDGVSKEVAHTIPGVLDKLQITPELKTRLAHVAANCDAEIIR
jgi:pyruvate-ferredoxin/flavodoxin oxidoreductase